MLIERCILNNQSLYVYIYPLPDQEDECTQVCTCGGTGWLSSVNVRAFIMNCWSTRCASRIVCVVTYKIQYSSIMRCFASQNSACLLSAVVHRCGTSAVCVISRGFVSQILAYFYRQQIKFPFSTKPRDMLHKISLHMEEDSQTSYLLYQHMADHPLGPLKENAIR